VYVPVCVPFCACTCGWLGGWWVMANSMDLKIACHQIVTRAKMQVEEMNRHSLWRKGITRFFNFFSGIQCLLFMQLLARSLALNVSQNWLYYYKKLDNCKCSHHHTQS
jgi:hypothetical protein